MKHPSSSVPFAETPLDFLERPCVSRIKKNKKKRRPTSLANKFLLTFRVHQFQGPKGEKGAKGESVSIDLIRRIHVLPNSGAIGI